MIIFIFHQKSLNFHTMYVRFFFIVLLRTGGHTYGLIFGLTFTLIHSVSCMCVDYMYLVREFPSHYFPSSKYMIACLCLLFICTYIQYLMLNDKQSQGPMVVIDFNYMWNILFRTCRIVSVNIEVLNCFIDTYT
jgi:hypothetical protein